MRIEYVLGTEDYVQYYVYLHHRRMDRFRKSRWYIPAITLGWLALAVFGFGFAFAVWKTLAVDFLDYVIRDNRIDVVIRAEDAKEGLAEVFGKPYSKKKPWPDESSPP